MQNELNKLHAGQLVIKAEVSALLGLVQELAKQCGVDRLSGLTTLEYFVAQRKLQLQDELSAIDGCKELEDVLKSAIAHELA